MVRFDHCVCVGKVRIEEFVESSKGSETLIFGFRNCIRQFEIDCERKGVTGTRSV